MASKANIAAQKELLELLSSGNNLVEKSSELLFDQLEAQKNISAKQKDQVKTLNLIVSNEKSSKDINEKINTLKSRAKQVSDKTLEVEIKKLKVQKASTTVVKQQSEALLSGLNKSISLVKKLPGGGLLISAMGLTDENMNKLKKGLGEFITGGRKFTEITKDMPKGFGKSLAKGYNKDGSYDQGLFQFNNRTEEWLEKDIYKRQLNMYDPLTNIKAAEWLSRVDGWHHWNSSKHCWGKYENKN